MPNILIKYLCEVEDQIPKLAQLYYNEWASNYKDINQVIDNLKKRFSKTKLPISLVALLDKQVIGAICLKDYEIEYENKTPWLASLIVDENYRNLGIGKLLINELIKIAKKLNYEELYLYTDNASEYYSRLNWSYLDNIYNKDKRITIFKKSI